MLHGVSRLSCHQGHTALLETARLRTWPPLLRVVGHELLEQVNAILSHLSLDPMEVMPQANRRICDLASQLS